MISIITIGKNNLIGFQETVESVLSQSFKNFEFILVDGNSQDGTKDFLKEVIKKHPNTNVICENDSGIYDAMNKGILAANGEYLLFLNSGDTLLNSNALMNVEAFLNQTDVVSADIVIEDKSGKQHFVTSIEEIDLTFFLEKSLYHQSTFISKSAFNKYGLYDTNFKLSGDYEFFIRLFFKHNATYKRIPHVISLFKEGGISNNLQQNELKQHEWNLAWKNNVSERTLAFLIENSAFKTSSVYWLYHKTLRNHIYKSIFGFIFKLRKKIYYFVRN